MCAWAALPNLCRCLRFIRTGEMTAGADRQFPIAAMMPISTENSGPASLASTVARAGA
jgi:hypothetical protein